MAAFRGRGRARKGCIQGDIEQGILPAGAAVGLVAAVRPAGEIVAELVREHRALLAALQRAASTDPSPRAPQPG
jgi:NAD(P)H-dependent flavin oxidoreductase YrpB (nitropropane dioxygenase family)